MAQFRREPKANPVSAFNTTTPQAGQGWKALAYMAETAYDALAPGAMEEMERLGKSAGRDWARGQIGASGATGGTTGGSPFRAALRMSESGGNAGVVNSEGYGGLYQWGQPRLDDYNRATGQNVSMDQFLGSAAIQEQAQDWNEADIMSELGGYVGRTVNGITLDAASIIGMAHLGGTGGARRFIESGGAYDPADSNGTNLSDYARKFNGMAAEAFAPVMLKDADGNISARMFSPMSGPILRAYNAAAIAAYGAEVSVKAATDLTGLANEFYGNPEGFNEAARGYIDEMMKKVPEVLQGDLRADLEKEVSRSFLGMVDRQHAETRERASNANMARIEMLEREYVSAVASGNPAEIEAAGAALDDQYRMRESLPGLAWTPYDSANRKDKAQNAAAAEIEKRQKEVSDKERAALNLIQTAAKDGRRAADESALADPAIAARHPDLYAETLAYATLRDELPDFLKMSPSAQRMYLTDARNQPVTADWEVSLLSAAEKVAANNATAWQADPVARAQEVLGDVPELPAFDPANPTTFLNALAQRAEYGRNLRDEGFTRTPVMISKAEAETLGLMFGKDVPPDVKLAAAGAIAAALGPDAAALFGQIKGDPVVLYAGQMLASGADASVARKIVEGQAMLDARVAQTPPESMTVQTALPDVMGLVGDVAALEGINAAARAIYAVDGAGVTDKAAQKAGFQKAVQEALGQTTGMDGRTYGGMQEVAGANVLLPPGIAGEDVDGAMRAAFGASGAFSLGFNMRSGVSVSVGGTAADPDIWTRAGMPSAPVLGGQPVGPGVIEDGLLMIRPVGKEGRYLLSLRLPGGMTDLRTTDGQPYIFDMRALIGAMQ